MKEVSTPLLSVVVPLYNETLIIDELYDRLRLVLDGITTEYEMIWVNDGSRDDTLERIRDKAASDPRLRYISFSRNFGHQLALWAGLEHSRGQIVVIMDGDLQDPPELIPELYAKYLEGFPIVYAQRRKREGESFMKRYAAKRFYRLISSITSIDIPLDTGDFRLIDRKVVDMLKRMPEKNKFLRGQVAWTGFPQVPVFFDRAPRRAGKPGYSLAKLIRLAIDGITSFSDAPLKMATIAGFVVSLFAFLVIAYALFSHFVLHHEVSGWTSLIISMMFVGGVQLITIGIIGEYISRIVQNVLDRPLYVIGEKNF